MLMRVPVVVVFRAMMTMAPLGVMTTSGVMTVTATTGGMTDIAEMTEMATIGVMTGEMIGEMIGNFVIAVMTRGTIDVTTEMCSVVMADGKNTLRTVISDECSNC
jgi:hypothetical protein